MAYGATRILGRLQTDRPGKPNETPWVEPQLWPNALPDSGVVDESSIVWLGLVTLLYAQWGDTYVCMYVLRTVYVHTDSTCGQA